MQQVLVVDDEANIRKVLSAQIKAAGYEVLEATNGLEALALIQQGEIDAVISDLRMPQLDGLGLLKKVQEIEIAPPVIVITAHGSMTTAIEAMKLGAFDFITKPFDKTELLNALRKATSAYAHEIESQSGSLDFEGRFDIIGTSSGMQSVYKVIEKAADTPSTVLITGESGTGKELIATALHRHSQRADKPLIRVNCAAIPSDLIESEFFGYEQGAFTGAVSSKPGRFELADGGTLFLDEIAEIPPEVQVKLLRALQESEFERIGGVKTIKVDVRVIAATNRNLLDDIEPWTFSRRPLLSPQCRAHRVAPADESAEMISRCWSKHSSKNTIVVFRRTLTPRLPRRWMHSCTMNGQEIFGNSKMSSSVGFSSLKRPSSRHPT